MVIGSVAKNVINVILAIIIIFTIVGGMAVNLTDSADNISGSGLPLASLFSASGVVLIIFMVGIFLAIINLALPKGK